MVVASSVAKYTSAYFYCNVQGLCWTPGLFLNVHFLLCVVDQDLSHMGDDEPYDYKFVKWMIKEKVS